METKVETKALADLVARPAPIPLYDTTVVALPPGWTAQKYEQEEDKLPAPARINRTVEAHEIGGFISYVNRFKSDATAQYCTGDKAPSLLARLDDHQPGKPSHVEHVVKYPCPVTEEWTRWLTMSKKLCGQKEFAEFIEDNIRDIVEPSGSAFLTAVTTFSDSRSVEMKSAQRLSDGMVQFSYTEKEGSAQQVQFPTKLQIAVPIFMGVETRYALEARVKYRIKEEQLVLWFELDRPDLVRRAAYTELLEKVEKETALQVHRAI
ncbi:MAG: DUF2303 family protein [Solimonas sp.]